MFPKVDEGWVRNEVDAFILKQLQANGLTPNPRAEPRELIGEPTTTSQVCRHLRKPSKPLQKIRLLKRGQR